jgi:parallel beta-helix repeat protein
MRRELICLLSACLALVVVLTSAARADLVCWWKFDEGSGTVAHDASGNGHDGVFQGAPQWTTGKTGGALRFSGGSGRVVDADAGDYLNGLDAVTVALWIKSNETGSDRGFIIGEEPDDGDNILTMRYDATGSLGGGRNVLKMAVVAANDEQQLESSGNLQTREWQHVTMVWARNEQLKLFVNGELDTPTANGPPRDVSTSGITMLIVGQAGKDSGRSWNGWIDDVRIYNQALSEGQIQAIMLGGGVYYPFASQPIPADGAIHEDTEVTLSWSPGDSAVSHDVYFGDNFGDVDNGTGGTFLGNWSSNELLVGLPGCPYPDGLVPGTTYYWRIDEVEADGVTKHRGNVWSFFVPSGKSCDPDPADGDESVAAYVTLSWVAGLGSTMHTVYFGDDPDAVEDALDGIPQTLNRYYPGELEFDKTYYWRVDEFDGAVTHRGDVWSFTTMPADASRAATYYVDGSNRLANDGNPGTEARPFKTIGRGVRSLQPGDLLLIKAGTYRERVILQRSGTQAQPIKIQAYPGHEGKVIINAAEPVTNWQRCSGPGDCAGNPYWEHIYVADVSALVWSHPDSEFAVRQVFQHGEPLNRSRYPDAGWSYPTTVGDPTKTFTDSSVSKANGYFNGAVCHLKTADWQIDQIPIASFSRGIITLAKSPRYAITTRYGYYITSIVGEINEEGEWAYDPTFNRLYLWPQDDRPEDVEFTYREYCLCSYGGTSWNIVRGLTMRYAYTHNVWLYRSNDMTIEDNTVEYAYWKGIHLQSTEGLCERNQIRHNTIRYCASRGIDVDVRCSYTNIEGNYVYATGTDTYGGDLMNGQSMAIYICSPYTRVYNNRVDRVGYSGIYVSHSTLGRDISHNYVTNIGLALADTGGFYTVGYSDVPEKDNIHHNIFVDAIGCRSMDRNHDKGLPVTIENYSDIAHGVFVDEEGNNRIIEHNTAINCSGQGIAFHWAPSNIVQKNTLYGNRSSQVAFSGKNESRKRLVDDVLLDNILFATSAEQKTFDLGMNYDDVRFGQSDRNYFYNPFNYSHIFVNRYSGRWVQDDLTLQEWRNLSGYDANSKEFGYLDQFEDMTIDPLKDSRIVYNASLDAISIDLESEKYCDVDGNKIYGSVSLQPFESKILIKCDF